MGVVGMPDPVWSDDAIDLIVRKLFPKPGDLPPMWGDMNAAEKTIIISSAPPISEILKRHGVEPALGMASELGLDHLTGDNGQKKSTNNKKRK
jgi:hypothetical protein